MAETILVVDDSRELRTILAAQLKKQGYDVYKAVDGQDGLEKAREIKPDLIIMDIMMPRMDGFTAATAMRQDPKLVRTPIILLSALGGEEDIIKGIECGADDYLVKPFKAPELSAKVKMLLRKAAGFTNRPEEDTRENIGAAESEESRRFKETGQIISKEFAGFEIVDKLGQGGSGTVYRAIEPINMSPVALKVVSPFVSQAPGFVDRFTRSSDISIRLKHPNIVRCYTIGEYQNIHYLTQELVEGPTLDIKLEHDGVFSVELAMTVLRQMAEAFAYLEAQGLIHRDIKPSNIFLVADQDGAPVAKLADFGLSRAAQDLTATVEGHVLGTPHYLSPEQAKGAKTIDVRGDLYSMAASVFHMISGQPPFEGDSMQSLVVAHISHVPPKLKDVKPDVPQAVSDLLFRFMQKDPADRCANMAEAIALIDAAMKGLPASSRRP